MASQEETTEEQEPASPEAPDDRRVRPEYEGGVLRRVVVEPPEDLEAASEPAPASDVTLPEPSRSWTTTTVGADTDEAPEPPSPEEPSEPPEITLPQPSSSWGITEVEPGAEGVGIPESAWPPAARDDEPDEAPQPAAEPEPPAVDVTLPKPPRNWGVTTVGDEASVPDDVTPDEAPDVTLPKAPQNWGVTPVGAQEGAAAGLAASAPPEEPEPEADFQVVDAAPKGGGDPDAGVEALAQLTRTAPPSRVPEATPEPEEREEAEITVTLPEDLAGAVGETVDRAADPTDGSPVPEDVDEGVDAALERAARRDDGGVPEGVDRQVEAALDGSPRGPPEVPEETDLERDVDEVIEADAGRDGAGPADDEVAKAVDEVLAEQGLD